MTGSNPEFNPYIQTMNISLENKILLLGLLLFCLQGFSQTLELSSTSSKMTVNGSSSLHDWEMKVGKFNGELELEVVENEIRAIEELSILIMAKSLDGGKSGMNEDAYEALRADTYRTINFEFENLNSSNCTSGVCELQLQGFLTVAGTRQLVTVSLDALLSEEKITLSGKKSLKMTDFKVEPPRAFLGLIRAYDDVTVNFELVFLRK